MNCSQLLERHGMTGWKRPSASQHEISGQPAVLVSESIRWTDSPETLGMGTSRWSEVRSWAIRRTSAPANQSRLKAFTS